MGRKTSKKPPSSSLTIGSGSSSTGSSSNRSNRSSTRSCSSTGPCHGRRRGRRCRGCRSFSEAALVAIPRAPPLRVVALLGTLAAALAVVVGQLSVFEWYRHQHLMHHHRHRWLRHESGPPPVAPRRAPTTSPPKVAATAAAHPIRSPSSPSSSSSSPDPNAEATFFYSVARTDRSGAHLSDRLLALAYGWARNLTYAGACHTGRPRGSPQRQERHEILVRLVGLQDYLPLACPPNVNATTFSANSTTLGPPFVPPSELRLRVRELWTPGFVAWVKSVATYPPPPPAEGASPKAVAHIRRGDVTPCGPWKGRYWPHSYYRDAIRKYVPPDVPITIYSEQLSYEPWDEFFEDGLDALPNGNPTRRNYTLRLGADVTEVWRAILHADYVILSTSSFAYLPALLQPLPNSTVVYAPFHMAPQPGWIVVDEELRNRRRDRLLRLLRHDCANATRAQWYESELRNAYWKDQ